MNRNIILCGVGGQGTILASRLIAAAALRGGIPIRTAETIGMAQRGGSVVSHVRIGGEIHSPLLPKGSADVLIGFEPAEAVRCFAYLKKDGVVVVNRKAVKPVTASLSGSAYDGQEMIAYLQENAAQLTVVDGDELCRELGSYKVLNIILLAVAAAGGELGISVEELKDALVKRMPPKFHALNLRAVEEAVKRYGKE
jgi:indolepyruvate ferredoxin oxidoreductase beta subunit